MSRVFSLLKFASSSSSKRLGWDVVSALARQREIQSLLVRAPTFEHAAGDSPTVGVDIGGFDYLNVDGLTLLASLFESTFDRGHPIVCRLPASERQQSELLRCGFLHAASRVAFLDGEELIDWSGRPDDSFILGRPRLTRLDSLASISHVQHSLDDLLLSGVMLRRLGLDPTSDASEWAGILAHAIHNILKNLVGWSGRTSGFLALQAIRHTLVRLAITDSGSGVAETLDRQALDFSAPSPLHAALLLRYYRPRVPGLFHVAQTVVRWGGRFVLRSGGLELRLDEGTRTGSVDGLAGRIETLPARSVPFLPGTQILIDFVVPDSAQRRR